MPDGVRYSGNLRLDKGPSSARCGLWTLNAIELQFDVIFDFLELFMKRIHIAALACFAAAILCYSVGINSNMSAGFMIIGGIFELVGWKNIFKTPSKKASLF
jgi:hypothetical protein